MKLPRLDPLPAIAPATLAPALGARPREVLATEHKLLCVFERADELADLAPDMAALAKLDRSVCVTAPGGAFGCDFVSRFFAPSAGIDEDPVTGSAHCTLTPFWSAQLEKKSLHARQVSARGGELFCEDRGDRVTIAGNAVLYLEGEIFI